MTRIDAKRLEAIVDGASKLPIENQEYILTTIKGMLLTRNLMMSQAKQPRRPAAIQVCETSEVMKGCGKYLL